MQEFDILKLYSEDNCWPYCSYCGKFRENAHVVAYRRWRMAGKVGDRSVCLLHRRTRMATRSLLAPCTVWNRSCGCLAALRSAGAATEVKAARPLSLAKVEAPKQSACVALPPLEHVPAGAGGLAAEAAGVQQLRARPALTPSWTCFIDHR